jgi:Ca2+-binding EF-hand superfamily protein
MLRTRWCVRPGLALAVLVGCALAAAAADRTKADPPGLSLYLGPLRQWFSTTDANSDNYLDKEELAKAFRGPGAKPYDYVPPPKDDKKDADKKEDKDPTKDSGSSSSKGASKTPSKADYSKYPDYVFLTQLDANGDGMVSRDEFESWAHDYALQLKQQADAQNRLQSLQQQLANANLSAKERHHLETALKKEQTAANKLDSEMKSFEKHLQQALKSMAAAKPPKK